MLPVPVNVASHDRTPARAPIESPDQMLAAYRAHQDLTGRGNPAYATASRAFLRRWPEPSLWEAEPLQVQLAADASTRPFIMFLLVTGRLHPGWDYLVHRKFSSIWRDVPGTQIGQDLQAFIAGARSVGYTQQVARGMASQVMARMLFATGKRLHQVTHADFDALTAAGMARQEKTGRSWRHYRGSSTATRTVLFHMGILPALPETFEQRWPFAKRMADVPEPMHSLLVRYLPSEHSLWHSHETGAFRSNHRHHRP